MSFTHTAWVCVVHYGALLVATGSIVPPILIHIVYDFVCFSGDPTLTGGIMTGELTTFAVVETIVASVVMAGVAVYLMKKLGEEKILSVWRTKWSQTDTVPSENGQENNQENR